MSFYFRYRRKLSPAKVVLLGQELDKIDWAEPENEVDEDIMATVTFGFKKSFFLFAWVRKRFVNFMKCIILLKLWLIEHVSATSHQAIAFSKKLYSEKRTSLTKNWPLKSDV